jgi:uncharacterized membrane protein
MRALSNDGAPGTQTHDWLRALPIALIAGLALITLVLPDQALAALNWIGYAVCHRIPARSFFVAGNQLPVCARDTGMFSAALLGLAAFAFVLRTRASSFPPRPFAYVFAAAFLAWAFDGVNSYFMLATGRAMLYTPQNWLRLATGAAMGIALSAYVAAFFNQAEWADVDPGPTVRRWRGVGGLALIALGVIGVVLWRPDFLYGPIALVSALGVIALLTIVNGLLVLIARRRHGRVERWSELALPCAAGLALTAIEIAVIDLLRTALTQSLNLPY